MIGSFGIAVAGACDWFRNLRPYRAGILSVAIVCGGSFPTIANAALLGGFDAYFYADSNESSPIDRVVYDYDYDLLEPSDVPVGTRSVRVIIDHSFLHAIQYYFVDYGFGAGNFRFQNLSKSELRLAGRRLVGMQGRMDLSGFVSEDEDSYDAADPQYFYYDYVLT
jgi:hypothetical protein